MPVPSGSVLTRVPLSWHTRRKISNVRGRHAGGPSEELFFFRARAPSHTCNRVCGVYDVLMTWLLFPYTAFCVIIIRVYYNNIYLVVIYCFPLQTRVRVGRRRNRDHCSRRHGRTSLSTLTPVRQCTPNGTASTTPRVSPSKSANRCYTTASEYTYLRSTKQFISY